jgi:hypothetical protein
MAFETTTVNIEDVFATEFDMDEAAAIADAQLLPQGDYVTVTPLNVSEPRGRTVKTLGERVNGTVQQLDEPVEMERTVIQFYGQAVSEDGAHQGKVSFDVSPQAVFTVDRRGRFGPDRVTKITQAIGKLYKADRGEAPANYGEIVDFVRTTPVKLFVLKMPASDDGVFEAKNLVISVSKAS